jgi:hypothetical protein
MREREVSRHIPRQPVPVAIDSVASEGIRGVLANVSELGACVWAEGEVAAGEVLVLRLGFTGEERPFQVAGRVVWVDADGNREGLRRCGLRWAHTIGPQHERLRMLIASC